MNLNITDLSHCPRKGIHGHMVPREQMTYMVIKGVKYRMCEDCKSLRIDLMKKHNEEKIIA